MPHLSNEKRIALQFVSQVSVVILIKLLFLFFFNNTNIIKLMVEDIYPGVYWTHVKMFQPTDAEEVKEFIYYADYNSSYTQVVSKNASDAICFFGSSVYREYSRYIHLKNAYCSSMRMIAKGSHLLWISHNNFQDSVKRMPTRCRYKNIVFLYSGCGDIFGHFLQDSLPAMLFIPREIIDESMILVPFKNYMIWLKYFDIDPSKVIYDPTSWFYANNLYIYGSVEPMNSMNIYSFKKLVIYLKEKLNVNNLKGTRYVLSNRKKTLRRSISNFDELVKLTKENWPQYNWENDKSDETNIESFSKNMATTKLLVAPSGSKLMNILFMNNDFSCGVCVITTCSVDYPNFGLGLSLNIWMIGFVSKINHYVPNQPCDIPYGLVSIRRLLYALENHSWPDDTFDDMRFVFDYQNIEKRLKQNPKKMFEVIPGCCYSGTRREFLLNTTTFE